MKILIIEDDASLREIMQHSLEKERHIVEVAPNFQTALQKSKTIITTVFCSTSCSRTGTDCNC